MITILGAGLAGLSCSYHLGHENCILFERNAYAGGHSYSHHRDGFVWDEGPHVSFTQHPYVRDLFEQSVQGELLEYPAQVSNYFQGAWIPHPAQSNIAHRMGGTPLSPARGNATVARTIITRMVTVHLPQARLGANA